jgi:protein gp37
MGQDSKIEWTHHTANLWHGCTKVHAGCDHCYAENLTHRWGRDLWGDDKPRLMIDSVWKDLDRYQKIAKEAGETHRVFVGSMMDIFEKPMPLINSKGVAVDGQNTGNLRFHLFYRIDRGDYPNLLFLFLTKRGSNINKMIFESWKETPPTNVMFGVSPVDQATARTLITQLLLVNGKRFLSIEPQIAELTIKPWIDGIDWVIQGGESGHHKRPFDTNWARKIKAECEFTKTAYFFKQIDKIQAIPEDLQIRQFPNVTLK